MVAQGIVLLLVGQSVGPRRQGDHPLHAEALGLVYFPTTARLVPLGDEPKGGGITVHGSWLMVAFYANIWA